MTFLVARPGVIREPYSAVLHGPASGVHPCLAPRSMRYCQHTRDRASGERARSADARWAQGMLDGQQGVRARARAGAEAESQRAEQAYTVRTRLVGLCWRRERETGERSERVRSRACEGVHGHASAHRARRRSHAPRGAPPDADSRGESARSSLDTIAPKARALGLAARPNSPQGQSARSGGPTKTPQGQSARSGGPTDSTARPEKKPSSTRNMDLWLIFSIAGSSPRTVYRILSRGFVEGARSPRSPRCAMRDGGRARRADRQQRHTAWDNRRARAPRLSHRPPPPRPVRHHRPSTPSPPLPSPPPCAGNRRPGRHRRHFPRRRRGRLQHGDALALRYGLVPHLRAEGDHAEDSGLAQLEGVHAERPARWSRRASPRGHTAAAREVAPARLRPPRQGV